MELYNQGIHHIYIWPRLFLSVASSMSLWACPSVDRGREGMELTPSKVPVRRPANHALQTACNASAISGICHQIHTIKKNHILQTVCNASAHGWSHRDRRARAHKIWYNSRGNDHLGWDLYGSQDMMCNRPKGQALLGIWQVSTDKDQNEHTP